MSENLNKIWAKAEKVSDYFDRIIAETPLKESCLPPKNELVDSMPTAQAIDNMSRSLDIGHRLGAQRSNAAETLQELLISGEVILVGRENVEGESPRIIEVDSGVWIEAKLSPEIGEAKLSDRTIDWLRVLPEASEAESGTSLVKKQIVLASIEKVPAPQILRPLAIQNCFESQSIDFDDLNLEERVTIYKNWIANQYPNCDTTQRGFSDTSFEADETNFKRELGLLAPKK